MGTVVNFFEEKERLYVIDKRLLCDSIEEKHIEIAKLKNSISLLELRLKISLEELKEYEDAYNSLGMC